MQIKSEVSAGLRGMAGTLPQALTDEELMLVLRNVQGLEQDQLFGELFRRYQPRVVSWCCRLTRNRTCAVDLAQDVFFKAYRHIHSFRGDARLSTWLYAVTRNHCFNAVKKMAADPVEAGESVSPGLRDLRVAEPSRDIEREQLNRCLRQMLNAILEPIEARVLILHHAYDLPLAAITQRLGLSNPSGAKAYIVNARRKLNAMINRHALTRMEGSNRQNSASRAPRFSVPVASARSVSPVARRARRARSPRTR